MNSRREFLATVCLAEGAVALGERTGAGATPDRVQWIEVLEKVSRPVLAHMANRRLKATMPVRGRTADRGLFTHLEALGRTLAGISAWLELKHPADEPLRSELAGLARKAIDAATDPSSPDYCNFERGGQPLVDAAFLAHAIIRAPNELWAALPTQTRSNVVTALRKTRGINPGWNNWLLFPAMVEAAIQQTGEEPDLRPVSTAVRVHESWYKGDGAYGDGPEFHWDYYNSFVILPMMLDIVRSFMGKEPAWKALYPNLLARARRYAAIQERMISPEGAYPPIGRSLAYRIAVFQLLGQIALMRELPAALTPAGVRCALTAVLRRQMLATGTFDQQGWLTVGFAGSQPSLGEDYISTGSCYLCATGFLPLGLPPDDPFWAGPPAPWTSKRIWMGSDVPPDHVI